MGNCCSGSGTVSPSPPTRPVPVPALTQETAPSTHTASDSTSSHVVPSSKSIDGMPAHNTAQHAYEMAITLPKHGAASSERMRPHDSTSSQRRRDARDHPPPSSGSNPHSQEMNLHPYRSRGAPSQLHKSISTGTTSQGPRSHSPSAMTRTSSTILPGHGSQPTGPQFDSGLALGTGQRTGRQERRPRFPPTLQSLLSNDFRFVARCRTVTHNNRCTIVHRFRILVVGKVCIMYHTGRRRN